jgi:tetratricopeptide (TPR) repeat protein
VFVADDLGAWLTGLLADAGRKKLNSLVLGSEQERALRSAATAAVQRTTEELRPDDDERAGRLALVISEVFGEPVLGAPLAGHATVLEVLRAGIAGQLAVLDDASLTGTGQSSADVLGVPGAVVAAKLTGHLLQEIVVRGSRGGPLFPLASQLNDDVTHLQGQEIQDAVRQFGSEILDALARLDSIHIAAAALTALAQLPPPVAGFTGRDDELAALERLLDPAGTAGPVVVSAVAGLAGVGKTTLAVEAGHAARRRGWFSGGVLFIDLHGYDDALVEPAQALDALLRALGMPAERIPPTVEERAGLYRSVLAEIRDPVLVIADNASAEAQIRPLLPGTGPHKMMVTSRHTLAGLDGRLVDVTVLDDAAAIELLDEALRAARPDDDRISFDRESAERLAQLCGGLPLALQIVAAVLKADLALNTIDLAGQLSDKKERLAGLRYDDGGRTGGPSVAAAFGLSYHRLDETAARVFRLLAVCPGSDASIAVAAVLANLPVAEVHGILAGLAAAHLIEAAPGGPGRWQMHDLVRLYATQLLEEGGGANERGKAIDRLLGHYVTNASAAADHLRALPGMEVPNLFAGRDAALAWLDGERASLVAAVQMAADIGRDQAAQQLTFALFGYFSYLNRFDESIIVNEIGLAVARRIGDRDGEGRILNNLGIALRESRRFEEAVTALQDAATIFRETGDRRLEGNAVGNLGPALIESRRFEEAITALQDAATIFRETGDRNDEGIAVGNLGPALREVGQVEEAIRVDRRAVAIFREVGDRNSEARTMTNLGKTFQAMERYQEAITAHEEALVICREINDRYGEAQVLNNLGVSLQQIRGFAEAISAHREEIAICREINDRYGEAQGLNNLGNDLLLSGRFDEAISALQDAATVFRETGDRNDEGMALNNLGHALLRWLSKDITVLQQAVAICGLPGGREGDYSMLQDLGRVLHAARQLEEVLGAARRAEEVVSVYQAAVASSKRPPSSPTRN